MTLIETTKNARRNEFRDVARYKKQKKSQGIAKHRSTLKFMTSIY